MRLLSLTRIAGIYGVEDPILPGRFNEIIICAPKREVRLSCDPDSDEIVLSGGSRKRGRHATAIIEGSLRVEWIWTMTDQQGYFDGLRIQVAAKQQSRVFEFISSGSAIAVFESIPR